MAVYFYLFVHNFKEKSRHHGLVDIASLRSVISMKKAVITTAIFP
jgi:hypothetical protein